MFPLRVLRYTASFRSVLSPLNKHKKKKGRLLINIYMGSLLQCPQGRKTLFAMSTGTKNTLLCPQGRKRLFAMSTGTEKTFCYVHGDGKHFLLSPQGRKTLFAMSTETKSTFCTVHRDEKLL